MPDLGPIAPIIPVTEVALAVVFFRDRLDFELASWEDLPGGGYKNAMMRHGKAQVFFIRGGPDYDPTAGACQCSAYIWVEDLDVYWDQVKERLADLPEGFLRPPFTQDYGMREFHVAFEAFLVFFGQPASEPAPKADADTEQRVGG